MKFKPKSLKSTMLIIVIVVVLIAAANFLGIGTMRSAIRIGYAGNDGWRSWSASYTSLDGTLKHTIHPKSTQETLHIEVITESGNISIEIKDASGNIIFEKDNIKTTTFDVKIPGKVVVRIRADNHKGSFNIEATE